MYRAGSPPTIALEVTPGSGGLSTSLSNWFRDQPIRCKLTLLMMLAGAMALLVISLGAVGYELARFRRSLRSELKGQGAILSAAAAAGLESRDRTVVAQVLSVLRTQPAIAFAAIFDPSGELFTQYVRPGTETLETLPPVPGRREVSAGGRLVRYYPILSHERQVGTLALGVDAYGLRSRFLVGAAILTVAVLISILASILMASRLQRIVAGPILALAQLARRVASEKDFSLRATKQGADEIGFLVEHFNDMLAQIQARDAALSESEERFRQVTESIQEVFWLCAPGSHELLYVSPAYEAVWGRTRAGLYQRPRDWLAAVHPEDRLRVVRALRHQQRPGGYDEEYRILRPDGEVRWIRDRAFPVRNARGEVYRVAGVAEDITERRRLEREVLQISEHEQGRIGRDLHDGLCQVLVNLGINASLLRKDLEARAWPESVRAGRMEHRLKDAIRAARHLAHGLCPVNLQGESLEAALRELARVTTEDVGVDCCSECEDRFDCVDGTVATHLYRIAQEAVHNAVKHAHPSHIRLRLGAADHQLRLTITDDGVGLPAARGVGDGLGLQIMKYRARAAGGSFDLRQAYGGGTVVSCTVPQLNGGTRAMKR